MSQHLAATSAPLVAFPRQAAFGRILPKNKIYEHSGANGKLKALFVEQVEQIVWQYKLAPETINLPARPGVPEIQVLCIQLKTAELDLAVLRCIDAAIPFPVIFELSFAGRTQMVAAFKRLQASDTSRWLIGNYFASAWCSSDSDRVDMPLAVDLAGLYEQLLCRLIPVGARAGESVAELVARVELITAKQREADKIASRLDKEKQFNRKVAINAELRRLKTMLDELK